MATEYYEVISTRSILDSKIHVVENWEKEGRITVRSRLRYREDDDIELIWYTTNSLATDSLEKQSERDPSKYGFQQLRKFINLRRFFNAHLFWFNLFLIPNHSDFMFRHNHI